jgi:simple sugar transport system substrate-binding protein
MSHDNVIEDVISRLEYDEQRSATSRSPLHRITRRAALTGGAAGVVATMLEACGSSSGSSASAANGGGAASSIFGFGQKLRFTFVNHVTTNVFFTPTQNGASDACKLLGCSYQWTGSQTSNVGEMVNAINSAVSAGVDGIATTLVDKTAFNAPVQHALNAGIPVVAYNADASGNPRLAYIGQDLYLAGQKMGQHIIDLVSTGDIALFIATPGALNIQPRINGAKDVLKNHHQLHPHVVATGASVPNELTVISSYATGHPKTRGLFAVDAGSTQGVAQTINKQGLRSKGVKGGGFDLTPVTEKLLSAGDLDFTIDQQPYLQGFLPVLELYLYVASQRLTGTANVNTGLKFINQKTVKPYVTTTSRYEGTGTAAGVHKAS